MAQYAKSTSVSSELSRLEIEKILIRYGAEGFAYATTNGRAMIGFTLSGKQVKFVLPLPKQEEFDLTPTGRKRTENSRYEAWEQACRQRWPAVDAMPVVRCKDCKRCKSDDLGNLICGLTVYEMEISKNDYCSYGEREDNDE